MYNIKDNYMCCGCCGGIIFCVEGCVDLVRRGLLLVVSVEQPDDDPTAGPKLVVVIYYIVLFMI